MAIRVVVVDDDDINRRGMAGLLGECPDIQVVAELSHDQAMSWTDCWRTIDVALVDAADDRAPGDQFPGVSVVEVIRRHAGRSRPTIVVVTGHFFDDAVRRRMREAQADFFYHRSELGDVRVLRQVVLRPEAHRRVPSPDDAEDEHRQGVTDATRVNRAVAFAQERDLERSLSDRPVPRSRAWGRLRREFNREARLNPVTADGRQPDRQQDLPSLPQIARFLAWATKVKTRGGGR